MKIKSIDTTVTPWDVTIKMLGTKEVKIQRPKSVTVEEWLAYWRHSYAPVVHNSDRFTWKDADDNTARRLAQIAEGKF